MKLFQKVNIQQRIMIVAILLLIALYASLGYLNHSISSKHQEQNIENQMVVFLEKLSAIITEVEKQTSPGFNHIDYASLKPHFNRPAFHTTDYPFLVDGSGNYIIHIYREGQRYPRERLNIMFSNPDKSGRFDYTEIINNKKQKIAVFYKKIDSYNAFIGVPVNLNEVNSGKRTTPLVFILLTIISSFVFVAVLNLVLKPIIRALNNINLNIGKMALGEPGKIIDYGNQDEVGEIIGSLNRLAFGMEKTAQFANEIGKNNLSSEFTPLGPNDILGNSLLGMRESLKYATQEEAKRKEEDKRRNWINSGLAKFGDILRQNNNNLQILSDNITQNLLNYLDANQGGLFIVNEEHEDEPRLELLSAFAYNRKKFLHKIIHLGEGLVGNCALERETNYLKEIPENYLEITSGLGDAPPRSLLIVPLKIDDKVFGVIEIASFNEFEGYEIEFVQKIGESIASTLSAVKNSIKTSHLLEQSQQQREEMAAQEEEMRQNMEEMQATQEEMARKTLEMESMSSAINETLLFCELSSNGGFQSINTNFLTLLGFTKGEIEEKTIESFIHPSSAISFNDIWHQVKNGHTYKGTLKWINRNNDELYVLSSITPAYDESGELFKIFFLGQDVTASKQIELKAHEQAEEIERNLIELQAEQEITQEREAEIEALLQALDTTCLVTEFEPNGRIIFINSKNEQVLGDKKETIEGKFHAELDLEAKINPQKYQEFWSDLLAGNLKQREFSLRVKGQTVWIAEHYTPIMNSNGEVVKIINIGIDISESKAIEQKLQSQIEELKKKYNVK